LGKTSLLRFIVSFYSPDHDNTNNVMVFGVRIVALVFVGSLLILADLNDKMMLRPRSSFLT